MDVYKQLLKKACLGFWLVFKEEIGEKEMSQLKKMSSRSRDDLQATTLKEGGELLGYVSTLTHEGDDYSSHGLIMSLGESANLAR